MERKKIKIDFRNFWQGFDKKNNFFYNLLKKEYTVLIDEKYPEYVFFSVFNNKTTQTKDKFVKVTKILPRVYSFIRKSGFWTALKNSSFWKKNYMDKRMCFIEGDFIKIFYTCENIKPDMAKCDWAFSFYSEKEINSPKHMRLPYYLFEGYGKNLIKKYPIKVDSIKFCNFLYSNEVKYRNDFFEMLSKYKKIDSPGKCKNNMSPLGKYLNPIDSRFSSKWLLEKQKFLGQYKFTIAFESFVQNEYTTEKIAQPMLAGSIPIYYGNPKISKEFNEKSFINVHKFKNFNEAIKKVIEIDNNDKLYMKMLKEPWFKGNRLGKYADEKRILDQLIKIVEDKK